MSISPNGKYVVTSGHDKTLRLWEKTQEPLVLDDEREIEREKEEEEQLATGNSEPYILFRRVKIYYGIWWLKKELSMVHGTLQLKLFVCQERKLKF